MDKPGAPRADRPRDPDPALRAALRRGGRVLLAGPDAAEGAGRAAGQDARPARAAARAAQRAAGHPARRHHGGEHRGLRSRRGHRRAALRRQGPPHRHRRHGVPAHRVRRGAAHDPGGGAPAAVRELGEPAGGVALRPAEADPGRTRRVHRGHSPPGRVRAAGRAARDLRGGAAHAGGRGRARGRGGAHRARDDPQGVRAGGHPGARGDGAASRHVLPRRVHAAGGDPAAAARAAPLPRAGVRGDHRPDRRGALHQGPAAAPRRAAARLRAPRASPPALLRAGVEAGRRAAARVPGQEAPPGHRGGRVRRHRGPRHPRGPARGAGRRDPRRVRRGRAPDPARRRRAPSGSPGASPSTS